MNHLRLLGQPELKTPKGTLTPNRYTAAVLSYLALEGSAPKYRLAGWLWPDSGEETAKNNMRQLLRRLRLGAGEIVVGEDHIELIPEVEVDVRQLSYLETPSLERLSQNAELLEGLEYDDAPDFEEWLASAREELTALQVRSARSEAERLERLGNHKQALEFAQVWARIEPLSEEAQRLVIRLHYLLGDRGAALTTFEDLKKLLDHELGTTPLPETLELIRMIERGAALQGAVPKVKEAVLPTAILRPPVMAGREREWVLMEEAWQAGKFIMLMGEGGVGKSRLATEFLASKGSFVHFETRPGDSKVPYSTNNRITRTQLSRYSDYKLPEWIRQTLAHWLPELGEASPPSPGLQTRYFEAVVELNRQIGLRGEAIFIDDLHYMDEVSAQMSEYVLSSLFPLGQSGSIPGSVSCYRKGEISPAIEQSYTDLEANGIVVRIELEPLPPEAVGRMLEGLGLEDVEHLAPGLSRYTGGNPLFITETLKHLIETNTLNQGLPSRLAPPGKVASLVGRRLQRLSPQALNLARAAAVAGTSFDLKLAAFVLERSSMELAEAHVELEAAQILSGNAFVHDLVFEATLAGIPGAVLQVLNARTAEYLESKEANPALIAVHWEAAGDGDQAAQWLIRATDRSEDLGLYEDMTQHLERAATIAVMPSLRLDAQVRLAGVIGPLGQVEEAIRLARSVLGEARDPQTRHRALNVLQNMYHILGRYTEARVFIDQALELALQMGEGERADGIRYAKAISQLRTGHYAGGAQLLEEILPRYRTRPLGTDLLQVLTALGITLCMAGRHPEALPLLLVARGIADASMGPPAVILSVSALLYGLICQGNPEELLQEAEELLRSGNYTIADHLRNNLALAYVRLRRADHAARHCRVQTEKARDPNYACAAWAWLASLEPMNAKAALTQAQQLYARVETPAAQFVAIKAAAVHGSAQQKAWARQELQGFERDKVPWLFLGEYEHLITLH